MIGQKFGRWTVVGGSKSHDKKHTKVFCQCICGTERYVFTDGLRRGKSRSCGCMGSESYNANRKMGLILDCFLGWTTEYLHVIRVGDAYALVDEVDYPALNQHNWRLCRNRSGSYYALTTVGTGRRGRRTVGMHRIVLDLPKGFDVDHRNCNGLDNRRENLRSATRSQNIANQRKHITNKWRSRYKGVKKSGRRWEARLKKNGIEHSLGTFVVEEEAALAYNKAAKKLFGEFALINEIPSLATEVQISSKEAVQS